MAGVASMALKGTTNSVTISPAAATTAYPLTLPAAQGGASTFLQNNGSGTLTWGTPAGGSFTTGDTKSGLQPADHGSWLLWTNGRSLSRIIYATLWNFVNTNSLVATGLFGAGDGSTTFTLGNINGRAIGITGSGTGLTTRTLGASTGTETQTLTTANLPSHTHGIYGDSGSGIGGSNTQDRVLVNTDGNVLNVYVKETAGSGSGTAFNNMQPTIFLNFFVFSG